MFRINKNVVLLLSTLLFFGSVVPPAHAVIYDRQTSDFDDDTLASGDAAGAYDIEYVEFAQSTEHPDKYIFFLYTSGVIKATTFNNSLAGLANIGLDLDGDGSDDFGLWTVGENLVANNTLEARFHNYVDDEDVPDCNAEYWSDIDKQVQWVGFHVDASCLPNGGTFGIQGYTSFKATYDFAPSEYFEVTPGLEDAPDDSEEMKFQEAESAVLAAELNNEKHDAAYNLVSSLSDGSRKSALEKRLSAVSDVIVAREVLEKAEIDYSFYDSAVRAIDRLAEGSVKTSFRSRLVTVKNRYDAAVLAAKRTLANTRYASCSSMNRHFPGGIARVSKFKNLGSRINFQPFVLASGYDRNKGLDRDRDGIVCER